jgi:4-carboxymuconolactone decarboxylase
MSDRKAPELDTQTDALVRVAAALAHGTVADLKARFAAARAARVPDLWVEELLLQSTLVVGYPRALVAFGVWRASRAGGAAREDEGDGGDGGDGAEDLAHEDWQAWAARGAAVCREVYGRAYHKLLVNLRALHPALEDLVLVDAYGKVIGRPGLDLKRRELCTVATIAVLDAAEQLHSHLRGALNTGASPEEVEAVLATVDADLDAERRRVAHEQWADVKRRML